MKIEKISKSNSRFSQLLIETSFCPEQLYVIGNTDLLNMPSLAVVGSRKVDNYGKEITSQLSKSVAKTGIVIVSGLALGVDSVAHAACIEGGGKTIAVMACGLNQIYPASNRQLAKQILESGGLLVSEYPEGTKPFKNHFPARNRIIAGLCGATLVTQAALKSGSLHTANFALRANREVLAVPGNINNPTAAGANQLIASGAQLVQSSSDVLSVFNLDTFTTDGTRPKLDNTMQQNIIDAIYSGERQLAVIQSQLKLSTAEFNQHLTMLEIEGHIRLPGGGQVILD